MNRFHDLLTKRRIIRRGLSDETFTSQEISGWYKIFELPFEPVWKVPIMVFAFYYTIIVLYTSSYRRLPDMLEFWYRFDLVYSLDILLIFGCKYLKGVTIPIIQTSIRPLWILILETISVIPFEFLVSIEKVSLYTYIRLLHSLKMARIFYFLQMRHKLIEIGYINRLLTFYTYFMFFIFFAFAIVYMWFDIVGIETDTPEWLVFIAMFSKLSTWGFGGMLDNFAFHISCIIFGLINIYYVVSYMMATVTNDLVMSLAHKFKFKNVILQVSKELDILKIPKYIIKPTLEFYDTFWSKRNAYNDSRDMFTILPSAMYLEIKLDMCFVALKHSQLFRDADVSLMRFIASVMSQKFLLPGELIYERDEYKNKMIYVVSGIIQIISEQDGETPIMSLSSGTCIGEASLIKNHISTNSVRSKNHVEIQELDGKDFIKLAILYPEKFRKLRKIILDRLKEAKETDALIKSRHKNTQQNNNFTITWIKSTLEMMMEKEKSQNIRNIFLDYEVEEQKIHRMLFRAKYLDMLVISDRTELNENAEFLRVSFPFILHPNSILLKVWEILIVILTLNVIIVLPRYVFSPDDLPYFVLPILRLTSYAFICDILLQIHTAVNIKGSMIVSVKKILNYRLHSYGFMLDILATLPLEFFGCISIPSSASHQILCLRLNRFLKIWRIIQLFQVWENKLHSNLVTTNYVKFTCLFAYLIYFTGCVLHTYSCDMRKGVCANEWGNYNSYFSAIQIVTGIGLRGVEDKGDNVAYLICISYSALFFVMVYIFMVAAVMLQNNSLLSIQKLAIEIDSVIKAKQLGEIYSRRIFRYMTTQWKFNRGSKLLAKTSITVDMPSELRHIMKEAAYSYHLKKIPYFRGLEDDILIDICSLIHYSILPPNEVVCYAGDMVDNLFIIIDGYCEISGDKMKRTMTKYEIINPLVVVYKLPTVRTCITKTYVKLLSIRYHKLMMVFKKYPDRQKQYALGVFKALDIKKTVKGLIRSDHTLHEVKEEEKISFCNFGYKLERDTPEEYEYFVPFDRLHHFSFIRVFLLRHTFYTNGKFMYVWEIFRSIFAIASGILHSLVLTNWCSRCVWIYVIYLLDLMAYIDIYIRFHVCYYNEIGIIVTHPLKTAEHYLSHGFLCDLLAVLPLEMLSYKKNQFINTLLRSNRLLQLHRYYGFITYIYRKRLIPNTPLYLCHFIPIMIVLVCYLGTLTLNVTCTFDENIIHTNNGTFTNGVTCNKNTWIVDSDFVKPISPIRAQLYGIYFVSSILNAIGLQGFKLHNFRIGALASFLAIIGAYYIIEVLVKVVICLTTTSIALSQYQENLQNLKLYMKNKRVDMILQKQLIDNFELRWSREKGKNVSNLMHKFHYTLCQDFLYNIYGKVLYENSIFPGEGKKFFRNLIVHTTHKTILKGGRIIHVNDVRCMLCMVFKGIVDIVASDGTVLDSLGVGGMFGNLDGLPNVRLTINIVANSHVEMLTVNSTLFHNILRQYPNLLTIFKMTTERFVHYLPCKQKTSVNEDEGQEIKIRGSFLTRICFVFKNEVLEPSSWKIHVWQLIFLTLACYVAVFLDLFQKALSEFDLPYIIIQYFCDLLYIINYYIVQHLAFEDENGNIVRDLVQIGKSKKSDKLRYYIYWVSMIPIDVLAWVIPSRRDVKYTTLMILKSNRLLRVINIYDHFAINSQKLNINVHVTKAQFLFIWLTLVLSATTTFRIVIGVYSDKNAFLYDENKDNLNLLDQAILYTYYFYFHTCCFARMAQSHMLPNAIKTIIHSIVVMLVFPIVTTIACSQSFMVVFKCNYLRARFKRKIDCVNYIMQRENINKQIVEKTKRYLNIIWLWNDGILYPFLLEVAPMYLKEAVLCSIYSYHINNHFIFRKCHIDFKRQLITHLSYNIFLPGDYIVFKSVIDGSMYFIHKGEVEVLDEDDEWKETYIKTLKVCNSFGVVQGLIVGVRHSYSYRATKVSIILSLQYKDFKYLLDFFPASKEIIFNGIKTYLDVNTERV